MRLAHLMLVARSAPRCSPRHMSEFIAPSDWFSALFGFREQASEIRKSLTLTDDNDLASTANGASYGAGKFTTPSLGELRTVATHVGVPNGTLSLSHVATSDIFELHTSDEYAGATFLAASQFNCLEFPYPEAIPEDGCTKYVFDPTQGPACALAAPAATVVRHYFAKVGSAQIGQTASSQINNLGDMLKAIQGSTGEGNGNLVVVRNGYTSSDSSRLDQFNQLIRSQAATEDGREGLLGTLRIGLHSRVEVPWAAGARFTLRADRTERRHLVSQVFCSALACGYSDGSLERWEPLAQLVLDASYEATLWAAAIEYAEGTGSGTVLLTALGGGVFENKDSWIEQAIARAIVRLSDVGLDVVMCHYRSIDERAVARLDAAIEKERGLV